MTKEAKLKNSGKTVSLINGAGKIDSYLQKNEIRTFSNTHTQTQMDWVSLVAYW